MRLYALEPVAATASTLHHSPGPGAKRSSQQRRTPNKAIGGTPGARPQRRPRCAASPAAHSPAADGRGRGCGTPGRSSKRRLSMPSSLPTEMPAPGDRSATQEVTPRRTLCAEPTRGVMVLEGPGSVAALVTSDEFVGVSVDSRASAAAEDIASVIAAVAAGSNSNGSSNVVLWPRDDNAGIVHQASLFRDRDGDVSTSVTLQCPVRGKNRTPAPQAAQPRGPADPLRHHLLRQYPCHTAAVDTLSEMLCVSTVPDFEAFGGPRGESLAAAYAAVHQAAGWFGDADDDDDDRPVGPALGLTAALPDLATAARLMAPSAPLPDGFASHPVRPVAGMSVHSGNTAAPGHRYWRVLAVDEAESKLLLAPETPGDADVGACRWLRYPAEDLELHVPANFDPAHGARLAEATLTVMAQLARRIKTAKAGGGDTSVALAARERDMVAAVAEGKLHKASLAQASATMLREAIHLQRTLAAVPSQVRAMAPAASRPLANKPYTQLVKVGSVVSAQLPGHDEYSSATVIAVHRHCIDVQSTSICAIAGAAAASVEIPRPLQDVWVVVNPMDTTVPAAVSTASDGSAAAPSPTHQGDTRRHRKVLRAMLDATVSLWDREKIVKGDQLRMLAGMAVELAVALVDNHSKSRRSRARFERKSATRFLGACGDQQAAFAAAVDEQFAGLASVDPTVHAEARAKLSCGVVQLCEEVAPDHLKLVQALLRRHVPGDVPGGGGRGRTRYNRFSTSPSKGPGLPDAGGTGEPGEPGDRRYYTAAERADHHRARLSTALMATLSIARLSSSRLTVHVGQFLGSAAWIHNVPKKFRDMLGVFGLSASADAGRVWLTSRAKASAQFVAMELERMKHAKGLKPVDRLWSILDNLNLFIGKDNHQTAASQAANPAAKNLTVQVLLKMSEEERFDGMSAEIPTYIVVGDHWLNGCSLVNLRPLEPTTSRLPLAMVPVEHRDPNVLRHMSKSLCKSLFDPDNAVTAGSVVQSSPNLPGPRCCACASACNTSRRNAGKHRCLKCEKAGATVDTGLRATESGLHPLTHGRVWKGIDTEHPGSPLVFVYEIRTALDAITVCPDLVDPSKRVLCPMRDQSLADFLQSRIEASVGKAFVSAVEHGNAGYFSKEGPRNKGAAKPPDIHRKIFPQCYKPDGQRKSFAAVMPRVILDLDEGKAKDLYDVLEQVNGGLAELPVSPYGPAKSRNRYDAGRMFHAQDQKTTTGAYQHMLDMATILEEGPDEPPPGVDRKLVQEEYKRKGAQASAHNPASWQLHQGMNYRDSASKTAVDKGPREVETAFLHATAQRLDKVAQNVRGKRDHESKETAAYAIMLVRRYNEDVPSSDRPVPPPDMDGWMWVTVNRGSDLIVGMGRAGQGGAIHPRGGASPAGSALIRESPNARLRGAVVYSFHLRGKGSTAPRTTSMKFNSQRYTELQAALVQARAGDGAPVIVVCRVKADGSGGVVDHADDHAAVVAAWVAYNTEWTRGAMNHARELVAASKDIHPGPVAGCDFARWVTQWFDRLAVQDTLYCGGKDCDFDATSVADLAMLKLFSGTGSNHYATHLRLNEARRRLQSQQLNVSRMALASVPWKDGGECQFFDAIQEIFIDLHQAAVSSDMPAARILDILTIVSLNIDLIRAQGDVVDAFLEGGRGKSANPRGGVGSVRRADVNVLAALYVRAGSDMVSLAGIGLSEIDRLRVAATAVTITLDEDDLQQLLDEAIVHKVQGYAGHYIQTNFNERLSFLVPGPGYAEVVAATVRLDGDPDAQHRALTPPPGVNHERTIIMGDGRGPLGRHITIRSFRRSHGPLRVHIPDRDAGPWQRAFKEVKFPGGAVLFKDSTNPADAGLSGAVVLSSRLRGAPAPALAWPSTALRSGDDVHAELVRNIEAARKTDTFWVVVTVLCPVEPGPGGLPPMMTLRDMLGLKQVDKVHRLTLDVWRDQNPIVPCDAAEVNKDAQRYRFKQTVSRHAKDEAARPESLGSEPMTRAGQVRREALTTPSTDAGARAHFARALKDRGLTRDTTSTPGADNKTIAPCASCYRSDLSADAGNSSTSFSVTGNWLSESVAHRKWMIKREADNSSTKHLLQQLAGDVPVSFSGSSVGLPMSPALSPGGAWQGGRAPSPHTPACRARESGEPPTATPDALVAWESELVLVTDDRDKATKALTCAMAAQDQADRTRQLADTATMSPDERASKTGAHRRAVSAVRAAEKAERAATAALNGLARRGPTDPTSRAGASTPEDPVSMPSLFD